MKRFRELDSLRGLAALAVVFHHFLLVFPAFDNNTYYQWGNIWLFLAKYTPVHIFWAGEQAVLFFFILSGFVLSIPFYSDKKPTYTSFWIKRICRIYFPYATAVIIAIFADILSSRHGIPGLSIWFNSRWTEPITTSLVVNHLLLLPSFDNAQFDPVFWSLVHEMRISLIFPFLMIIIQKLDWRLSLGVGILVYFLFGLHLDGFIVHFYGVDYITTFRYIVLFIAGALLAKHRDFITGKYKLLPRSCQVIMPFAAIIFITYPWLIYSNSYIHQTYIDDLVVTVGASLFIAQALAGAPFSRALHTKPLFFLGRISYSLYLCHSIVLLTFINILYNRLPMVVILISAFIAALILSTAMYYCIEATSIKLGKILSEPRSSIGFQGSY